MIAGVQDVILGPAGSGSVLGIVANLETEYELGCQARAEELEESLFPAETLHEHEWLLAPTVIAEQLVNVGLHNRIHKIHVNAEPHQIDRTSVRRRARNWLITGTGRG